MLSSNSHCPPIFAALMVFVGHVACAAEPVRPDGRAVAYNPMMIEDVPVAGEVQRTSLNPRVTPAGSSHFFVLGAAGRPGKYMLKSKVNVLGAISMAGGHSPRANLRQVVVFRRDKKGELLSTTLDMRVFQRGPHPAEGIWMRNGDMVILPNAPIQSFDHFVNQVFTEGKYGLFPSTAAKNLGNRYR